MARRADPPGAHDDLAARIADAGFTPSVRRVPDLLDLLAGGDEDVARRAERAVLRVEVQYAVRVAQETVARGRAAERPARGRIARLAGRLAREGRDPEGALRAWLLEALSDPDPKTRRASARGLGALERDDSVEAALAEAFDRASAQDEPGAAADKAALALALGRMGGEAAQARVGGDGGRAAILAARESARRTPSAVDPSAAHDGPLRVWFHTRSGLEDVLKEELGERLGTKPRFVSPGVVQADLTGPLARALEVRTATHIGFPLTATAPRPATDEALARAIVQTLDGADARAILGAFTRAADPAAPIRFRLAFASGGRRRSLSWRVAELTPGAAPGLLNDPRESTWEAVVDDRAGRIAIELVPRGHVDERFAYRQELVPAASHPTVAAALARVAPRRDADVVWDPFAGAGSELVERARLGPYARLLGTDSDPRAVEAARTNLARAGVAADVLEADACAHAPDGVTLILTNPPMGRRVQRGTHADLLERFVSHAARVLVPGGALVWLVPEPRRVRARAASAGLELDRASSVDMGGFPAELSVYVKPAARRPPRRGARR